PHIPPDPLPPPSGAGKSTGITSGGPNATDASFASMRLATSTGQPVADTGVTIRSNASSTDGSFAYSTQCCVVADVRPSGRDGVHRAPLTQRTPRGQWLMQNDGRQPFASVHVNSSNCPASALGKLNAPCTLKLSFGLDVLDGSDAVSAVSLSRLLASSYV